LLKGRVVILGRELDERVAQAVIEQLLALKAEDGEKDVTLYVSSPGGSVTATLAIFDTVTALGLPVATFCLGQARGTALLLLAAGVKGRRVATREAHLAFARPFVKAGLKVDALRELKRQNEQWVRLMAAAVKKPAEEVAADLERQRTFTADEALAYGLIDEIVEKRPNLLVRATT
jgi:ATP-dependent Clp protease protease subunit